MKKALLLSLVLWAVRLGAQPCTPNTHSISFNGTSDYVSMPAHAALNLISHVSVEAWINSNAWGLTSAMNSIVCKHGWSSGEGGYVLRAGGQGELSFNIAGLDTNGTPTSWVEVISQVNALALNTWIHVAGTYDGDSLNLYINGQLTASTLFKGSIVNSPAYDLKIGRLSDNQPGIYRYWSGMLDEIRVWDRKVTEPEIYAGMNTQIDPALQTGLVAYWRLNDGSGTSVSDLSVNAITGTLLGSGWTTTVPFTSGAPNAVITPSGNTTFCQGDTVILDAGPGTGLNYLWSTGATTQSIQVAATGTYTVTVSDTGNCSAVSAPLSVTVNPAPAVPVITFNGSQLFCSASTGIQWYLNGNTLFNQVNPVYTPLQNGSYTVIVTDNNGCTSTSAPFVLNNLGITEPAVISGISVLAAGEGNLSVSFHTGKTVQLDAALYSLDGRMVISHPSRHLPAGNQVIHFPGKGLTSGTYLLILRSDAGAFQLLFPYQR